MTKDEKSARADNLGSMTHDPYYITLCKTCGGITAAYSAFLADCREIVEEWTSQGRRVAYITDAPRLSCSCGSVDLLAAEDAEIEALKARQITSEIREAIQQALRSYAIDLDISGSLPEAYHELFALLKPLAQEGKL